MTAEAVAERGSGHHGVTAGADRRYLRAALLLLAGFMVAEVVVAIAARSLVLWADAGHMLADVGALAGALWAMSLASRPAAGRWTFGWKRAEIVSAALNGVTLLVAGGIVTVEAIGRLVHPPATRGGPVLVVALVGVVVNLVITVVLARADRTSLNVDGAFKHVLTDLYGFAGTALAGLVIVTTGYERADAIASLLVVALMVGAAWGLLRESGRILLEVAPASTDLDAIRSHLLREAHVRDVHDLHVWTLTSELPALSAHVVVDDACFSDGHAPALLDELQACLAGHFDVEHSTFQLEPASHAGHEQGAHA